MKVHKSVQSIRQALAQRSDLTVGFIPTMGHLHAGHAALIQASLKTNDLTVVSIFVNKQQFNCQDDFNNYPRTEAADRLFCNNLGVDHLFTPEATFAANQSLNIQCLIHTDHPEYQLRPGHFEGMLSIVLKLLNVISPNNAYFGEKDALQLSLVKELVQVFYLPCKIIAIPTVRDQHGIALSSRNSRLAPRDYPHLRHIYAHLKQPQSIKSLRDALSQLNFEIEYLYEQDGVRHIAYYYQGIRFIDNITLKTDIIAEA